MRWLAVCLIGVIVGGCSSKKSSLLLERQARGPIEEEPAVAQAVPWRLEPPVQTLTLEHVEVTVQYASRDYLANLFSNKKVFGAYAGKPPYYPEHLVFYVKVANRSAKRIWIAPKEFVLIDDRGNQYHPVGTDYVTAHAEARNPVASTTRGVLEGASPGYFGFSVPVGKIVASKPQGPFALLQQSSLQTGYLYPGVVHDGLVAFWNPSPAAKKLLLLITNIKTNFDANDEPKLTIEFPFNFDTVANR
jgi:hypothetical protein